MRDIHNSRMFRFWKGNEMLRVANYLNDNESLGKRSRRLNKVYPICYVSYKFVTNIEHKDYFFCFINDLKLLRV